MAFCTIEILKRKLVKKEREIRIRENLIKKIKFLKIMMTMIKDLLFRRSSHLGQKFSKGKSNFLINNLVLPYRETDVVAVDCEMVEVDRWSEGLARLSIINYYGVVLIDKFVIPEGERVTNYRTWVSGVTPDKLKVQNGAIHFKEAKQKALEILKDKIIVGHSLKHDF
jgi:hypothetical protein